MKTKIKPVTNSSSSSFIIADKTGEGLGIVEVSYKINLKDYIDESLKTVKELDVYYEHNYVDRNDDDYRTQKEIIENGGTIYILYATNESDNPVESFMCEYGIKNFKFPENVVVIQGEGGF